VTEDPALESGTVTLTLKRTAALVEHLSSSSMRNLYDRQADRFQLLGGFDLPLPSAPVFAGGTMSRCETVVDAVLLRAYEEACGYTVTRLWDLAMQSQAVLSSRPFAVREPEV
jgi:hypothetical protein